MGGAQGKVSQGTNGRNHINLWAQVPETRSHVQTSEEAEGGSRSDTRGKEGKPEDSPPERVFTGWNTFKATKKTPILFPEGKSHDLIF